MLNECCSDTAISSRMLCSRVFLYLHHSTIKWADFKGKALHLNSSYFLIVARISKRAPRTHMYEIN
jgi:hypothetical protein